MTISMNDREQKLRRRKVKQLMPILIAGAALILVVSYSFVRITPDQQTKGAVSRIIGEFEFVQKDFQKDGFTSERVPALVDAYEVKGLNSAEIREVDRFLKLAFGNEQDYSSLTYGATGSGWSDPKTYAHIRGKTDIAEVRLIPVYRDAENNVVTRLVIRWRKEDKPSFWSKLTG